MTAALSLLLNDVHPDVVRAHWSGKGDALEVIQRVSGWSRSFVRRTVGAALRRLLRIGRGESGGALSYEGPGPRSAEWRRRMSLTRAWKGWSASSEISRAPGRERNSP